MYVLYYCIYYISYTFYKEVYKKQQNLIFVSITIRKFFNLYIAIYYIINVNAKSSLLNSFYYYYYFLIQISVFAASNHFVKISNVVVVKIFIFIKNSKFSNKKHASIFHNVSGSQIMLLKACVKITVQ